MQVGDLVTASCWGTGYIGIVVSIREGSLLAKPKVCRVMINDGTMIDQLITDLEIVCK